MIRMFNFKRTKGKAHTSFSTSTLINGDKSGVHWLQFKLCGLSVVYYDVESSYFFSSLVLSATRSITGFENIWRNIDNCFMTAHRPHYLMVENWDISTVWNRGNPRANPVAGAFIPLASPAVLGPNNLTCRTCVSLPFCAILRTQICIKWVRSGFLFRLLSFSSSSSAPSSGSLSSGSISACNGTDIQPLGSCISTTLTSSRSWKVTPDLIPILFGV